MATYIVFTRESTRDASELRRTRRRWAPPWLATR